MREKVQQSRNTAFFPLICGSGGSKSRLAKPRVRSQLARWKMKNCAPLSHEAHLEVKSGKTPHVRSTFGSWDVENMRAFVARSTFGSEHVQHTPCSYDLWELWCQKSGRRCGTKHIWKWKCAKHQCSGHLWKSRCRPDVEKSARHCGAKHISKSKVLKIDCF